MGHAVSIIKQGYPLQYVVMCRGYTHHPFPVSGKEEEEEIKQIKKSRVGLLPELNKDLFPPQTQTVQAATGFILEDQTKKK